MIDLIGGVIGLLVAIIGSILYGGHRQRQKDKAKRDRETVEINRQLERLRNEVEVQTDDELARRISRRGMP
jgi:hypothetical protein